MALTTNLGLPSTSLEPHTLNGFSYFTHWNKFDTLDQQEPVNVDPPRLSECPVVQPWPQLPVPESPPTQRDWDNYRSTFTQLYQVEERPLKEVKELLEQHYGFKATERMYKRRINAWNVTKNYKREDKEAVCRALQRRSLAGKVHHQVMIRGQPAKVRRILRHVQSSTTKSNPRGRDCHSMSTEDDEIEVCTPHNTGILNDQSTFQNSVRDLLRRLSVKPSPSRPILTHDDLGEAEILCLESARYFDTLLSSGAYTRPIQGSTRFGEPDVAMNKIYAAVDFVDLERYTEARIILNKAFDELKDQIREQSPKLLPAIIAATFSNDADADKPFQVHGIVLEHAGELCDIHLGVRHPVSVVISIFRDVGSKAEVWNAVIGALLDVALRNPEHSEGYDLLMYLLERRAEVLQELGRFREAEQILQRALTICKPMQGTDCGWTLEILNQLAWLNFDGLQNYSEAKAIFQNVLQSGEHEHVIGASWGQVAALSGLAWIAGEESDLPKSESLRRQALKLALKTWGAKHDETISRALLLERSLRVRGKDAEADHIRDHFCLKDDSFI